jgi:hypothetical protein
MVMIFFFLMVDERNIDEFYPKVVLESQGKFNINLTFNNQITLKEGKIFLTLGKFTQFDTRYDLGFLTNSTKLNREIDTLSKGTYEMELFYYNDGSFELRSMFSMSKIVNITFCGTSSISLISEKDLFYVQSNESILVQIDLIENLYLDENRKQFVKCKLGNETIPTTYIGNNKFNCSLFSSISRESTISMVYKNSDAYNQELLLSTNTFKITFTGLNSIFKC